MSARDHLGPTGRHQPTLGEMVEHAVVIDVSRYYPASGQREALLAGMLKLAAAASASGGCFGAQTCASDRDEKALVAISRWASEEALSVFANSRDFIAQREALTLLLAAPAEHEHFRPVAR